MSVKAVMAPGLERIVISEPDMEPGGTDIPVSYKIVKAKQWKN